MSDRKQCLLSLEWVPGRFAVCRFGVEEAVPEWALASDPSGLLSVTRTDRELSIVASEGRVPTSTLAERGWVAMRVVGTMEFGLVGVISQLTGALADAGVPVLAISTYDTDLLLVKSTDAGRAVEALGNVADCVLLVDRCNGQ